MERAPKGGIGIFIPTLHPGIFRDHSRGQKGIKKVGISGFYEKNRSIKRQIMTKSWGKAVWATNREKLFLHGIASVA